MSYKKNILCFANYYLPSYKAGGPVRTIENMVNNLSDSYQFLIIARDRDFGSNNPFVEKNINAWNNVGNAKVYYSSPEKLNFSGIKKILNGTEHDILYFNSFFSFEMTIIPLLVKYLGFYSNDSIVIAPRGEFSKGAIKLKKFKKRLFIAIAKFLGIYDNLIWQASSSFEKEDIIRVMSVNNEKILIAPDLLPIYDGKIFKKEKIRRVNEDKNLLKIIFLSRITPKKNLDFLLKILAEIENEIQLSIYGPIDDKRYWDYCNILIKQLPTNIKCNYEGEITPDKVSNVFSKHDVFAFPTLGENFGHVIFESISVGTPVIISDQTPWKVGENSSVSILSLNKKDKWISTIEEWASINNKEKEKRSEAAYDYAINYLENNEDIRQNIDLFEQAYRN